MSTTVKPSLRQLVQLPDRSIPASGYTILRLDAAGFASYAKYYDQPFDIGLFEDLSTAASKLVQQAHGTLGAYVVSDEVCLVFAPALHEQTWCDGNESRILSLSGSILSSEFNAARYRRFGFRVLPLYFSASLFYSATPVGVLQFLKERQELAALDLALMASEDQELPIRNGLLVFPSQTDEPVFKHPGLFSFDPEETVFAFDKTPVAQ